MPERIFGDDHRCRLIPRYRQAASALVTALIERFLLSCPAAGTVLRRRYLPCWRFNIADRSFFRSRPDHRVETPWRTIKNRFRQATLLGDHRARLVDSAPGATNHVRRIEMFGPDQISTVDKFRRFLMQKIGPPIRCLVMQHTDLVDDPPPVLRIFDLPGFGPFELGEFRFGFPEPTRIVDRRTVVERQEMFATPVVSDELTAADTFRYALDRGPGRASRPSRVQP